MCCKTTGCIVSYLFIIYFFKPNIFQTFFIIQTEDFRPTADFPNHSIFIHYKLSDIQVYCGYTRRLHCETQENMIQTQAEVITYIESIGYKVVGNHGDDFIFEPRGTVDYYLRREQRRLRELRLRRDLTERFFDEYFLVDCLRLRPPAWSFS